VTTICTSWCFDLELQLLEGRLGVKTFQRLGARRCAHLDVAQTTIATAVYRTFTGTRLHRRPIPNAIGNIYPRSLCGRAAAHPDIPAKSPMAIQHAAYLAARQCLPARK
jgi:hypothetical protein